MKLSLPKLSVCLAAFAFALSAAQAQVIIVDFTGTVATPFGINNYNAKTVNNATTDYANLRDTSDGLTGISLDTTVQFIDFVAGNNTSITGAAAAAGFTLTELSISMYTGSGATAGVLTLGGLDSSKTYTFTILASRQNTSPGDNRITTYTLTGSNNSSGTLNAAGTTGNNSNVLVISSISPTLGGTIALKVDGAGNGTSSGYLNALRIDVVPEPSSMLLFGVGAVCMGLRRRVASRQS